MYIADLHQFPDGMLPSPYQRSVPLRSVSDYRVDGFLPRGTRLFAVGWLGDAVPTTGKAPDALIDALVAAHDGDVSFSDGSMGAHSCEVCREGFSRGMTYHDSWRGRKLELYGHGHHLVRLGRDVYVCPAMILHYVLRHDYLPPSRFIEAVANGAFLREADLLKLSELDVELKDHRSMRVLSLNPIARGWRRLKRMLATRMRA